MSNIINVDFRPSDDTQDIIDDIAAMAFMYIRDQAEGCDIPVSDVVKEAMLGLAMVIATVEGKDEAKRVLDKIIAQMYFSDER